MEPIRFTGRAWGRLLIATPALCLPIVTAGAQPCDPGWATLGSGANSLVSEMVIFDDDGPGPHPPSLIVGGFFQSAGGAPAARIARWDGAAWSPVGLGVNNQVSAFAIFDEDGDGPLPPALFAAGFFTQTGLLPARRVAKWDGTAWVEVGGGITSPADASVGSLAVFDDDGPGPHRAALYAGGYFTAAGGVALENIARWDGVSWSALGNTSTGTVTALAVFDDDGPGPHLPELVASGFFGFPGGQSGNIARWNGVSWSPLGEGTSPGGVDAFLVFDEDGAGPLLPALFAGGNFASAGGAPAANMARWNGSAWSPLGSGMDFNVLALAVFDEDGPGPLRPALFAGGNFTMAGGVTVNQIARWDGMAWSALDGGTNSQVGALLGVAEGLGGGPPTLFAGGFFTSAGGMAAAHIAAWVGCGTACSADFNADGVVNSQDFFDFLAAFFTGQPSADFNHDAQINSQDFFDFVAAFFLGC